MTTASPISHSAASTHKRRLLIADIVVHGLSLLMLLPLIGMLVQAFAGGAVGSRSPLGMLVHVSGETSERLLIASLLCTPLNLVFGWTLPNRYRKWLGLYAMLPLVVHVVAHVVQRGSAGALVESLSMVLGTIATVLMVMLTVTSLDAVIKALGATWRKLHYSTYAVAILMELHVLFVSLPRLEGHGIVFGAIVAMLLAMRLPAARRFFVARRRVQRSAA